jgi:hypothetical protein
MELFTNVPFRLALFSTASDTPKSPSSGSILTSVFLSHFKKYCIWGSRGVLVCI